MITELSAHLIFIFFFQSYRLYFLHQKNKLNFVDPWFDFIRKLLQMIQVLSKIQYFYKFKQSHSMKVEQQSFGFEVDRDTFLYESSLQGLSFDLNFAPSYLKQTEHQVETDSILKNLLWTDQECHNKCQLQFQYALTKSQELQKDLNKQSQDENSHPYCQDVSKPIKVKNCQEIKKKKSLKTTKNILVNFKKFHFKLITDSLGNLIYSDNEIQRIKKIGGITMKDYEYIYNIEQLRPIFDVAFKKKTIYRYLMTSRIKNELKKFYLSKIQVFEKAFRRRVFDRINY